MDTLVYYRRNLASSPATDPGDGRIRLLREGEAEQVEAIARECFRDYGGHYHADPRLDRRAFSTFSLSPVDEGELLLGAVSPRARGSGLYRLLTLSGMYRLQSSGANRFVTSTYLGNWGAQASWAAAGLSPHAAYHTFHRWFDKPIV